MIQVLLVLLSLLLPVINRPQLDYDPVKAPARAALIKRFVEKHDIILSIEARPSGVVEVVPVSLFPKYPRKSKKKFAEISYAYGLDHYKNTELVRFRDGKTGKELGTFSAIAGLKWAE
jgi:hypothetical protein